MSIAMEYRGPALAAAVGDWRATFFAGQSFLSNPGGTDWAVSVVDGVAYDGAETLVTLRSAVLTPAFAAAQVGRNPAGDVQAHAARHRAGGLDPLSHADLAGVAAGTMTHAQIDAYLDDVSELLSGLDADLAAEAAALAAHKTATPAHTAGQVGLGNVTNDAQVKRVEMGMPGGTPTLNVDALVVQDPVSASTSPGPGAIPKAGLSGLLDAWISAASTAVAGLVQLATNAVAWAGTSTSQVITAAALWYVLTLATRLRISVNTTIYVSPTGSDSTGAGTEGTPYASIGRALLSIAGKSIDDGVMVTIQCADGIYTISNAIIISHDNADKIQILGNISAETTVPISSIDTTAKTITVAGNYVSNADTTKNIVAGDIIGLTGSSTSGLNGAYIVSERAYSGGNTIITCAAETTASATVGGGSVVIKPCNRCVLTTSNGSVLFYFYKSIFKIDGFSLRSSVAQTGIGLYAQSPLLITLGDNIIFYNLIYGIQPALGCRVKYGALLFKKCSKGIFCAPDGKLLQVSAKPVIFDGCTTSNATAYASSYVSIPATYISRNAPGTPFTPALNTLDSTASLITTG